MELMDFVQSIGAHISFSGGEGWIGVDVTKNFTDLSYRPYPGGSGSIGGRAKLGKDLNAAYENALADLADTFNQLDCRQVGFDIQPLWIVPQLVHTKGYRGKATKRKAKAVSETV